MKIYRYRYGRIKFFCGILGGFNFILVGYYDSHNYPLMICGLVLLSVTYFIWREITQKIEVSNEGLNVKRGRKKSGLIHWGMILSVKFPNKRFGTKAILLEVQNPNNKVEVGIYANMGRKNYKELLKNIVEKATKAEIDPKIKKYID